MSEAVVQVSLADLTLALDEEIIGPQHAKGSWEAECTRCYNCGSVDYQGWVSEIKHLPGCIWPEKVAALARLSQLIKAAQLINPERN